MSWLGSALAPDWRLEDLDSAVEAGCAALIADSDGQAIGVAVALLERPAAGAASVPFIAVAPERRFRGLGGEAGLALERFLRDKFGVAAVYAPIPDWRGLAVYFWLRLGYAPCTSAQAPWPLAGLNEEPRPGIWLVRDGAR
jgi:GNAT superfamily N-acetyltransferase